MKFSHPYRHLAFAMRWQIRYEAYNKDIDAALNSCLALLKFARHQQGQGLWIEQLVAIATEAVAHSGFFAILQKTDAPADTLKNIQQALKQQFDRQKAIINLQAEKTFWYDFIQRGFTDDGKGSGRVLKQGLPFAVNGRPFL